jgi:hypothetical protein
MALPKDRSSPSRYVCKKCRRSGDACWLDVQENHGRVIRRVYGVHARTLRRWPTASEIFPLETRALAIACFYALGTAIGGGTSPLLFGWLIESGSSWRVSFGYVLAALLLLIAAVTELKFGIDAEGKSLESIADPLSSKSTG